MIGEALAQAAKDIAPPLSVAAAPKVAALFGVPVADWLLYLGLAYATLRLLAIVPRLIGCGTCFWKHKTCTLDCKTKIVE